MVIKSLALPKLVHFISSPTGDPPADFVKKLQMSVSILSEIVKQKILKEQHFIITMKMEA
jgi:hypothetical protein